MLKDQSAKCFIQTLEILQNKRGQFSTIILDHASTHCTVHNEHCSNTVNKIINSDGKDILAKSDIHFVIAESKRHQKVGLAERQVNNVKQIMNKIFPSKSVIPDIFEMNHKLSLIEAYLNDRTTYALDGEHLSPYIFQMSTLKRAKSTDRETPLLSQYFLPNSKMAR